MPKGGRRHGSGQKPKPTELKVVQGTFRGDRHAEEAQPAVKGWPEAPAHLTEREAALWGALREHCEGWSAPSDWLAFNGIVSLTDRLLRNQEAQRETVGAGHPLAYERRIEHGMGSDGAGVAVETLTRKENPLISQEMKLWRELRAFIGLTGLSPADRARMRVTGEDKSANPLDRFIKKSK